MEVKGWQEALRVRYAGSPEEDRRKEAEGFRRLAAALAEEAQRAAYPEVAQGLWQAASMADERARLAEPDP